MCCGRGQWRRSPSRSPTPALRVAAFVSVHLRGVLLIPDLSRHDAHDDRQIRSKANAWMPFGLHVMDVEDYDTFELRVRSDGRTYILNVQTDGQHADNLFQAFMYTNGGPHWERLVVRGVAERAERRMRALEPRPGALAPASRWAVCAAA